MALINAASRRKLGCMMAVAASYILLAVIVVGANPFRGQTTGPFDLLASYPGWNPAQSPVSVRHSERSDILDSLLPDWLEARRQIRSGDVPLWNPLPAGGRAGLIDPTRSLVSPAFFAFAIAGNPATGFYLATLVNLFIAGLGMHLFASRYLSSAANYFAGITYMMCGFFAGWLYWPHILTAIWLPWLLLFVCRELDRHRFLNVAAIAASTALMVMGGFPFVFVIGLSCALAMVAISIVAALPGPSMPVRGVLVQCGWVVLGLVCGLALVSVPLLSLASLLSDADLTSRSGGSPLTLAEHGRLLLQPWASREPRVESNMYVGMLALPLCMLGLARTALRPRTLFGVAAAFYLLVGIGLTFGLLPLSIGAHLPVLSNNPWSRAILLLDVAIIMLAAIGVDVLFKRLGARGAGMVVCLSVVAAQGADVLHQFRKFNGPTSASHFYDARAVVSDLGAKLGPFEYAAQDGGTMMVSGTAGAVGVGDWFAHAMRSKELHNLLDAMADEPFSTPTATIIDGSDYHWNRPIMDIAANCYVIHLANDVLQRSLLPPQAEPKFAIGPINSTLVSQVIELPSRFVVGSIGLRMATYAQSNLEGTVRLALVALASGQVLASSEVDASSISDNQTVGFRLTQPLALEPGRYRLDIHYDPQGGQKNLTLWAFESVKSNFVMGGRTSPGVIGYSIFGPPDPSIRQIANDGVVAVSENLGCMKGPYWTQALTHPLATATTQAVRITRYKPHDISFEVQSSESGYLVVPMNFLPGWRVTVDNKMSEIRTIAGVIPAVPLSSGLHKVRFAYSPPNWKLGAIVSALGLIILIAGGILDSRKRKGRMYQ